MCKRFFPYLLALMVFLTVVSCTDRGETPVGSLKPTGSPNSYHYMAHNAKGDLSVSGTISLTPTDSITVSGTWSLTAVLPSETMGPQTGTGTLIGSIVKSSVSINLNPGWADNNVFLQGTLYSDSITGTWMWSTFIGPTAEGKFQAIRMVPTHISNN